MKGGGVPELTLVVNCTDRKSVRPAPDLRVRTLAEGGGGERFQEWSRRVSQAKPVVELQNLYQGEAWSQVGLLVKDAQVAGFNVSVLVASAGLGLRPVTSLAPAYSATFSSGKPDTVVSGTDELRSWWGSSAGLEGARSVATAVKGRALLVLSESYARAMHDDLVALGGCGGDLLLVGGARDVDGLRRVRSDRALRAALGGTASSVNLRIARAWIAKRRSSQLYDEQDEQRWSAWAASVRKVENYGRIKAGDEAVVEFIQATLARDPSLSATRALRVLRDAGVACEQARFGSLFRNVTGVADDRT